MFKFIAKNAIFRLGVAIDELRQSHCVMYFWHRYIAPFCTRRVATCDPNSKYRTIDGTCNNLKYPLWGRSNRQHRRLLTPVYEDGRSYDIIIIIIIIIITCKK
jgi:hypothetical protein